MTETTLSARTEHEQLSMEVAACLPVVEMLCQQLEGIATEVEDKVVSACGSLSSVVQRTEEIVGTAAKCIEGDENEMGSEALIGATRSVLTSLLTVTRSLGEVSKISDAAKLVALNGRIEAARAGEQGKAFSVVARETGSLADKAKQTSQVVNDTVIELETILKAWAPQTDQRGSQSSRCIQLVEEILHHLDHHTHSLNDCIDGLGKANQLVTQEITNVIITMQFQDAINQRITLVAKTLSDICVHLQPLATSIDPETTRQRTQAWQETFHHNTTMNAERDLDGELLPDDGGDVELF